MAFSWASIEWVQLKTEECHMGTAGFRITIVLKDGVKHQFLCSRAAMLAIQEAVSEKKTRCRFADAATGETIFINLSEAVSVNVEA